MDSVFASLTQYLDAAVMMMHSENLDGLQDLLRVLAYEARV